ncbi:MAG: hypothetical protein B6I19_08355 [Bacteroidetes bacterium 4572_114]|nr:MAG: hypothetical protein B6I19_08355 [Bacteroidetes bacterium 4572_114]
MKNLQDQISTIMSIKNLTNAEFAAAIGVQPSNISHIMSGRNKPSLDLIMKIVKRYPEIRLDWLLQGEGSMNKEYDLDLFGNQLQKSENKTVRNAAQETHISQHPQGNDQILKTFEPKKAGFEGKATENQGSNEIENEPIIEPKKDISTPATKTSEAGIEKIVFFFRDKSFQEYYPKT